MSLIKRFPSHFEILPVYATITFLTYSWTIIHIFWKLPSWLNFLTAGEIGIVVAYSLTNTFFESLIVLTIVLVLSIVLPANFLRSKFIVRGSLLVYLFTFWVALFDIIFTWLVPSLHDVLSFVTVAILVSSLLLFLLRRVKIIGQLIASFGDRLLVLLYIWLPISVIGVLVVIVRMTFFLFSAG